MTGYLVGYLAGYLAGYLFGHLFGGAGVGLFLQQTGIYDEGCL